jgi:hypothetical protein
MTTALDFSHVAAPASAPDARPAARLAAVGGGPIAVLRLEGSVALGAACFAYASLGGSWGWFTALFLVPDVAMLGYLAGPRVGAASYHAAHSYLGPALVALLGASLHLHALPLGACIWAAHVGFDRMLGYGLKYATAFGDTHLGLRGRRTDVASRAPAAA